MVYIYFTNAYTGAESYSRAALDIAMNCLKVKTTEANQIELVLL